MASVTVTPTEVQVGDSVTIDGLGFIPSTKCTVSIPEVGESFEVTSDVSGEVNSDQIAAKAFGTLTASGNAVAAETVTIDGRVYTWRAAVTTTANEVLVGASASASLDNLKAAINLDPAGSGTLYGSLTTVHPTVGAGAKTATTLIVYAKTGGTAGNSLTTTEAMTNGAWGAGTLASGAAATGNDPLTYTPTQNTPFTVKITDGTNSAQATVKVFSE